MSFTQHRTPSEEEEFPQVRNEGLMSTDTTFNSTSEAVEEEASSAVQRKKPTHRSGKKARRAKEKRRVELEERIRESDEKPENREWANTSNQWEGTSGEDLDDFVEKRFVASEEQMSDGRIPPLNTTTDQVVVAEVGTLVDFIVDSRAEAQPEERKKRHRAGRKRNKNKRNAANVASSSDDPTPGDGPATGDIGLSAIAPDASTPEATDDRPGGETEASSVPAPFAAPGETAAAPSDVAPSQPLGVSTPHDRGLRRRNGGEKVAPVDVVPEDPIRLSAPLLSSSFSVSSDEDADGETSSTAPAARQAAGGTTLYMSPFKRDWAEEVDEEEDARYWEKQKRRFSTGSFITDDTPHNVDSPMPVNAGPSVSEDAASDERNRSPVVPPRPTPLAPGHLETIEPSQVSPAVSDSSTIESVTGWKIRDGVQFYRQYPHNNPLAAARHELIRRERPLGKLKYRVEVSAADERDLVLKKMFEVLVRHRHLLNNYDKQKRYNENIINKLKENLDIQLAKDEGLSGQVSVQQDYVRTLQSNLYELKINLENEEENKQRLVGYAQKITAILEQAKVELRQAKGNIETASPSGFECADTQPEHLQSDALPSSHRSNVEQNTGERVASAVSWTDYEARLRSSRTFKETLQRLKQQRWRERQSTKEFEDLRKLAYSKQFGWKNGIPSRDMAERYVRWSGMA